MMFVYLTPCTLLFSVWLCMVDEQLQQDRDGCLAGLQITTLLAEETTQDPCLGRSQDSIPRPWRVSGRSLAVLHGQHWPISIYIKVVGGPYFLVIGLYGIAQRLLFAEMWYPYCQKEFPDNMWNNVDNSQARSRLAMVSWGRGRRST